MSAIRVVAPASLLEQRSYLLRTSDDDQPEKQPERQRVSAADVFGVERAVADAVVLERLGPLLLRARAVVIHRHLGRQQDRHSEAIRAEGEVEVLRRAQRAAAAERLVEPADALQELSTNRHVCTHAEPLESLAFREPLAPCEGQRWNLGSAG